MCWTIGLSARATPGTRAAAQSTAATQATTRRMRALPGGGGNTLMSASNGCGLLSDAASVEQGPLLVRAPVARPEDELRAVRRRGAVGVQAEPRLGAGHRAVGVEV